MEYQAYTRYDGFTTGPVYECHDSDGQIVYVDNGDWYAVVWVKGNESSYLRDEPKSPKE